MFKFKNIGGTDRVIRVMIGVGILAAGLVFQSWLGLIGLIVIGTVFMGVCPIYLPFGINTRKKTSAT